MDPLYASLAIVSLSVVYVVYRRYSRISISDIPGPKPSSFWLGKHRLFFITLRLFVHSNLIGNIPELTLSEFGEIESQWQAQYGNIIRIKASLGVRMLH
jgi:hypothetical protein